jgi:hypothetical protein
MTNEYTEQDRACVNCRHFRRRWNPIALIDTVISDGTMHYRCQLNGVSESINPITGRKTITIRDQSCKDMRSSRHYCGREGDHWHPSEQFMRRKENLLKVIKNAR